MIIITDSECEAVPGSGISERVIFPEWRSTLEIMYAALVRLEKVESHSEDLASGLADAIRQRDTAIAEAVHWKANHDNQVAKTRLLTQRDDIPVDRLPAYREMERLQARIAELEAEMRIIKPFMQAVANTCEAAEKECKSLREQLRTARAEERSSIAKVLDKMGMIVSRDTVLAIGDAEPQKGEGE
jgi:hypothetical protein